MPIPKTKNKYKEFIKIINKNKSTGSIFWSKYLGEFKSKNKFLCYTENDKKGNGYYKCSLDNDMKEDLQKYSYNNNISLATLFYGAWAILLSKYMDTEDIVFGTTVSGRNIDIKGINEMIGLFINTIPLKTHIDGEKCVYDYLESINADLIARSEFENTPLTEIKLASPISNMDNLFDNIVVIENYPVDNSLKLNQSLKIESFEIIDKTNYDLTLGIFLIDNFQLTFEYRNSKFEYSTISNMAKHYQNILKSIVCNNTKKVSDIQMLSLIEIKEITENENYKTSFIINDSKLKEEIIKTHGNVRTDMNISYLSYEFLNNKADQLVPFLIHNLNEYDKKIGLILNNTVNIIIAIFAIFKVGKSFFIIDSSYDEEYYPTLLIVNNIGILIIEDDIYFKNPLSVCTINIDNCDSFTENRINCSYDFKIKNLTYGYLDFTLPNKFTNKIGQLEDIINYVLWYRYTYLINEDESILYFNDKNIEELLINILISIFFNCKLIVIGENYYDDIWNLISNEKIIMINGDIKKIQHHIMNLDFKLLKELKTIYLPYGYDSSILINKLLNHNIKHKLYYECFPQRLNYQCLTLNNIKRKEKQIYYIYILNKNKNLCGKGIFGDLWIASDNANFNNLNQYGLEKYVFINPYNMEEKTIYKTKFKARWLFDNELEINGIKENLCIADDHLINLSYIETQLLKSKYIQKALVNYEEKIVAYIVLNKNVETGDIRKDLSCILPNYMMPEKLIVVDQYTSLKRKPKIGFLDNNNLSMVTEDKHLISKINENIFDFN